MSDASSAKNQISKSEYLALVTAMAQLLAGPGKTPSPFHVQLAENNVKKRLADRKVTVMNGEQARAWCSELRGRLAGSDVGGESVGGFWDKVKSAAASTLDVVKKYGKYAVPLVPVAVVTPAAVLAYKQYQKAKADHEARGKTATTAAPAAAAPAAAATPEAPKDAPAAESAETSLDISVGSAYVDVAREALVPPQLRVSSTLGGVEEPSVSKRSYYFPSFVAIGASVPHEAYRAAIWKKASKLGKGAPSAAALCKAQAHVDRQMAAKGIKVQIPGSRPSRVTR